MGKFEEALHQFECANRIYDPTRHQSQVVAFGQDPGIASKIWEGHTLIHMGCFDKAKSCWQQALQWSKELSHPYTHAFTLLLAGCTPSWYLNRFEEELKNAKLTMALVNKGNFTFLKTLTSFYLGNGMVTTALNSDKAPHSPKIAEGFALMEKALEEEAILGATLGRTSRFVILADLYLRTNQTGKAWEAIHEAEQIIANTEERYFEPELLRVKSDLYLAEKKHSQSEIYSHKSRSTSLQQKAAYWDSRARTHGL